METNSKRLLIFILCFSVSALFFVPDVYALHRIPDMIYLADEDTVYFVSTGNIYDDSALYAFYGYKQNPQKIAHWWDFYGSGEPKFTGNIVAFGGRFASRVVGYYEDVGVAKAGYGSDSLHHLFVDISTGETLYAVEKAGYVSAVKDYFVIQAYLDGSRYVLSVWGLGARGTYAAGLCFIDIIIPNIQTYTNQAYIFSWTDIDQDGMPQPEEVDLLVTAFPAPSEVENWAVIIGISEYADPQINLDYTDDDAVGLYNALLGDPSWQEAQMRLLVDGEANKRGILDALDWMASKADMDDRALFYFSGHGSYRSDIPPYDEVDGWDEALFTYDLALLSDDELDLALDTVEAGRIVVMVDTCWSSGMYKSADSGVKTILRPAVKIVDGFKKDIGKDGRVVLASCDDYEISYETPVLGHGVFTYYIIEGLGGLADLNYNGIISAEELYNYVSPRVSSYTSDFVYGQQNPQICDGYAGELEFFNIP